MGRRRSFIRAVAAAATVAVLATATFAAAGPAAADEPPTSTSDFVPLAIEGFEQTVAGPGGLVPNPDGSSLNDYIWSAAEFDGVLCALVLDYIEAWEPVFREFCRILKPGGWLLISAGHPLGDWQWVKRGIPVRVEVGPRSVPTTVGRSGEATLASASWWPHRRDRPRIGRVSAVIRAP